jgi:hypothetical protein
MHRQLYKGLLILWIEFRIAHIIGVNGGFMFPPPFLSRVRIKGGWSRHYATFMDECYAVANKGR